MLETIRQYLGAHPATFAIALAAFVVWMLGNLRKVRRLVKIGIILTIAAAVTFLLGY